MSDSKWRELERRWRTSGSVDDEAAWLREGLRAGALSERRIATAAHLGSEAAGLALGPSAPSPPEFAERRLLWLRTPGFPSAEAWCATLEPFGWEAAYRIAVAIARFTIPTWERASNEPDCWLRTSLAAVDAWLACPCADHARSGYELHLRVARAAPYPPVPARRKDSSLPGAAVRAVAHLFPLVDLVGDDAGATWCARYAARNAQIIGHSSNAVFAAAAQEVLPWALGPIETPTRE